MTMVRVAVTIDKNYQLGAPAADRALPRAPIAPTAAMAPTATRTPWHSKTHKALPKPRPQAMHPGPGAQ